MDTIIEINNLSKIFRTDEIETCALNNISMIVKKGEFISIMGPSGCGKSTLLNILGMLDDASEGEIFIDGKDIVGLSEREIAKMRNSKLGFIFQSFHLISALSVIDNVELPLLYRKGVTPKERRERAEDVLKKVGLEQRMKHYPSQLSGGQCQRVAIARALIGQPEILLADEPTGNLDSKMGEEIMNLLIECNKEGNTIIMVTHDPNIAARTGRVINFHDGKIVKQSS